MDLKEFVSQTLIQVTEGVRDSQKRVSELGGEINPHVMSGFAEIAQNGMLWGVDSPISLVKFDVALTTTKGTGTKGGIGVVSGIINLGSSGESKSEDNSVSHVSFIIPMSFPKTEA